MECHNKSKKGGVRLAITNVTYSLNEQTNDMSNVYENTYEAQGIAPNNYGEYSVSVMAYDDSGNVAVLTRGLVVSAWIEPKIDWKSSDRFNIEDFNRIRNNIIYLHSRAVKLFTAFDLESMGSALTNRYAYWEVQYFNAFEKNIEMLSKSILKKETGKQKTFYENGIFIDWQELNRIENFCLSMKIIIDAQAEMIRNLPFRLGAYKEVRI